MFKIPNSLSCHAGDANMGIFSVRLSIFRAGSIRRPLFSALLVRGGAKGKQSAHLRIAGQGDVAAVRSQVDSNMPTSQASQQRRLRQASVRTNVSGPTEPTSASIRGRLSYSGRLPAFTPSTDPLRTDGNVSRRRKGSWGGTLSSSSATA